MSPSFVIVATEDSADILGASLIDALKERYPEARFEGIGGKRMISQGFHSFYPMERLSVMGLIEPLKRLSEILQIRSRIKKHVLTTSPSAFIGIDAPDFNLSLEEAFKAKGIKTVHYVSPTVWAWRKGRIKKIKKAVDLMLILFPFEMPIYQANAIPVAFVGHPLADTIPMVSAKTSPLNAKIVTTLPSNIATSRGLSAGSKFILDGCREQVAASRHYGRHEQLPKIIALLPGSRAQELRYLLKPFIETAKWLLKKDPTIRFVSACANPEREQQFREICLNENAPPITILPSAQEAMTQADAILVASGTASLQSMLVKRPTVVAYKMSPLSYQLMKYLIKVPFIALPNLLAEKEIMPEYIQHQVQPERLGEKLFDFLQHPEKINSVLEEYTKIHTMLKRNAGKSAAKAIAEII